MKYWNERKVSLNKDRGQFWEILRPHSSQWQSSPAVLFQPGWISQDGWHLASEIFHGLWANHRLLSHFKPTDCPESQGGAKVWVPESQSQNMCQNSAKRPGSNLSAELDTPVCTHKCLSLDTDEQISSGAHPAASWEDPGLWQRHPGCLGWGLCTGGVEQHLGSRAEPLLDPPPPTLTSPWQCLRLCWEGLLGPWQPCLAGEQHEVIMLLCLCAGLHSPWMMIPGKKDQLFWRLLEVFYFFWKGGK